MEKFLKENIQPAVRLSSPALKTFTFKKIHFGHIVSSEELKVKLPFSCPMALKMVLSIRVSALSL